MNDSLQLPLCLEDTRTIILLAEFMRIELPKLLSLKSLTLRNLWHAMATSRGRFDITKLSRASRPKVKTGCITCKTRRVKCDETKPECLRCQRFDRRCDGYGSVNKKPACPVSLRLPKPARPYSYVPILSNPSKELFKDEQEYRYYRFFFDDVAHRIRGSFLDFASWVTLILHASQDELALHRTLAALGALGKTLTTTKQKQIQSPSALEADESEYNCHYRHALQYYSKALRRMRNIENTRTALVACLLVFCFESFNGRPDLAITYVRSGLKLLLQWFTNISGPQKRLPSSESYMIEDDLIYMFIRMDLHLITDSGVLLANFFKKHTHGNQRSLWQLPTIFADLQETRLFLERITTESFYLAHSLVAVISDKSSGRELDCTVIGIPRLWNSRPRDFLSESEVAQRDSSISKHRAWFQSLGPLWKRLQTLRDHPDFISAAGLQLSAKLSETTLLSTHFTKECSFDSLISHFREIVSLSKLLVNSTQFANAFWVSFGTTIPLFMVASKCRDRALRREAIALLRESKQQEGVWDSVLAANAAVWMMELEEGDNEDLHIPEERRVRLNGMALDFQQRQAKLRCTYCREGAGYALHEETAVVW